MNYTLNNIPISAYGAIPVVLNEQIALEGLLTMPKRKGETEYDWGTSIEPFVEQEDILFEGRTLTLNVFMQGENLSLKIKAFTDACLACTSLGCDFGTFKVICKDEIEVEKEKLGIAVIKVKFYQDEFIFDTPSMVPANTGNIRIDGYNLYSQFGIIIESKDSLNRVPARIDARTTDLYLTTDYRELKQINITGHILGTSSIDLYFKMRQFQAIMAQAGFRTITFDSRKFECYMKDGIDAQFVHEQIARLTLKLIIHKQL